jgi:FixJ family two-component response regulator
MRGAMSRAPLWRNCARSGQTAGGTPLLEGFDVRVGEQQRAMRNVGLHRLVEHELPIIFLTGYPDIPTTVRGIKAGAEDFLTKPVSSDKLLQTIQRAIAHHNSTYRLKSRLNVVHSHIAALTPRERQVFELVIRGKTNKAVARAIGGTERAIKAHRRRVMEKMQVQSLTELVSLAERVGVFKSVKGQTS